MTEIPRAYPMLEPEDQFRVPSAYTRCRRQLCKEPPVADMARHRTNWRNPELSGPNWWAYCAEHLAVYNREVRDGRVWWKGAPELLTDNQ
jgi:hypothetical protein